ncbi:33 kDa inner dynein arm light chain, axonemal-like [Cimex lectularius]|uniref:Uncharacterized protein n=1 Tax=Cimex lectularius TaxID=79782 RepID=A0A8I6SP05_CIMLE|nr:33 kDa inner dynein arm light chain, axonemal-like [Cimex lectularius]
MTSTISPDIPSMTSRKLDCLNDSSQKLLCTKPKKNVINECTCTQNCVPKRDPFYKEEVYKLLHDPEVYNPFKDKNVVPENIHSFLKCAIKEKIYKQRRKRSRIPRQRYRGDKIEMAAGDPERLSRGVVRILRFLKPVEIGPSNQKRPQVEPVRLEVNVPVVYPDLEEERYSDIQEVLDGVFPPIEWIQNNKLYKRQVSPYPAHVLDIKDLSKYVDYRIGQCKVKNSGVCEGRYRLFLDVFDELVRQEIIACPERGLQLARVRDDVIQRIEVYKELFEECDAKLSRIFHLVELGAEEIMEEINTLKHENLVLENFVICRTIYYEELLKDITLLKNIDQDHGYKDLKYYEDLNERLRFIMNSVHQYGRDELYRDYEA